MDSAARIKVRDAIYIVASRAPTANDDRRNGAILIGSRWIYGNVEYRCDSDLFEHAVWTLVGGGGSSAPTREEVVTVLYVENASAPTINDDVGDGYVVGTRWLTPTDEYVCIDSTAAAAVWKTTTAVPTITVTADDVTADAHAELTGTTVQSQLTSIGDRLATLSLAVYVFLRVDGHNSVLNGFDGAAIISTTKSLLS